MTQFVSRACRKVSVIDSTEVLVSKSGFSRPGR